MFNYFPDDKTFSQGVSMAINAGGDINDIDGACRRAAAAPGGLTDDSWYQEWFALGARIFDLAEQDEAAGHRLSASHKFRRSCVYFALAERFMANTEDRKLVAYKRMLTSFARFVAAGDKPIEFVEVPYPGGPLPGIFIPAAGGGPAPTVLFIDGFDTFKEMMYLRRGNQARPRGLAMLIVDTPGIGGALRLKNLPTRADTEVPVAACVDYLQTRPDVDAERIGLMGVSMGGYYAPRAASFEPRIKACVAWGAMFHAGPIFRRQHAGQAARTAPASQMLWVTGQDTVADALDLLDTFALEPILGQLTVPLLILHGEDDHIVPWEQAEQSAKAATGSPRVDLVRGVAELGGANHCSMDNMESGVDILYDWMADVLTGLDVAPIPDATAAAAR